MEKPKTLREHLEDDFKKFKKFIKEKKNYIFWIIVMFITIQFTDVLSLGASWDEMVKQNPYLKKNGTVLRGGRPFRSQEHTDFLQAKRSFEAKYKGNLNNNPREKKELKKKRDASISAAKKKRDADKKARKEAKTKEAQGSFKEAQDRQAIRDAKKKDKKKTPGIGKSFQSFREGGPMVKIFGNMFNMFRASLAIFAILLALAGAASIPVILFLVLTYKILEFLAGKLQQL
tara:strand:- start:3936 stop:4628 length:693 start_codon:yes stop_codon:yes gene_type:complete